MKYKTLKRMLDNLSINDLEKDVLVYLTYEDEYVPADFSFTVGTDTDVLDDGHPILIIE